MELDNNNHSVFSLYYHLVLVVKYRRNVIDDEKSDRLKAIFEYITPRYNMALQEWNHDKDHIHLLFKAHPNSESRSYCLLTTGGAPIEVIKRYIESQGEKL